MAKIEMDLDYMKTACDDLEEASIIISEKIKSEKRIIRAISDFWEGPDYVKFNNSWEHFIKIRDPKIIDQTSQYAKFLKGFYDEVIDIQKDMKKLAKGLPQG